MTWRMIGQVGHDIHKIVVNLTPFLRYHFFRMGYVCRVVSSRQSAMGKGKQKEAEKKATTKQKEAEPKHQAGTAAVPGAFGCGKTDISQALPKDTKPKPTAKVKLKGKRPKLRW